MSRGATAYADLAQTTFTAGERSYTLVPIIPAEDAEESAEDPGETQLTVQVQTTAGPEATLTISAYEADSYVASLDGFAALVSADKGIRRCVSSRGWNNHLLLFSS